MNVFVRPTGQTLGQTLGFGPNGSAASLDTAPVNAGLLTGDYLLVQSGGALAKVLASNLFGSGMSAWLATLPTSYTGLPIGAWWNNGGTPVQVQE